MSDGTHSTPGKPTGSKRKVTLIVAGTAAALLAAGVCFQIFRAEEGSAGENGQASGDQAPGVATTKANQPRMAVARVNGELVPYDLVAQECMKRHGEEVLDNVINRMLIQQACEQRGIVVTAEEVEHEIGKIARKFELEPESWFQMLQLERKISPDQYRSDIIWPMLALRKLAGDELEITEDDIKKAFVRDFGPRVKSKMIMMNNFRRAQEVWNEVNENPEEFGRLAQKHSVDSTSKSLRGDIPPIRRYAGHDNLEVEAFKLREGEISGIIDVSVPGIKRYVILKCEGRTEPIITKLEEVRTQIMEQLEDEKTQASVAKVFEALKNEARIDNFLTATASVGVRRTSANGKTGGNVRPAGGPQAGQAYPQSPAGTRPTKSAATR